MRGSFLTVIHLGGQVIGPASSSSLLLLSFSTGAVAVLRPPRRGVRLSDLLLPPLKLKGSLGMPSFFMASLEPRLENILRGRACMKLVVVVVVVVATGEGCAR